MLTYTWVAHLSGSIVGSRLIQLALSVSQVSCTRLWASAPHERPANPPPAVARGEVFQGGGRWEWLEQEDWSQEDAADSGLTQASSIRHPFKCRHRAGKATAPDCIMPRVREQTLSPPKETSGSIPAATGSNDKHFGTAEAVGATKFRIGLPMRS